MRRVVMLLLAGLLFVPTAAGAQTQIETRRVRCGTAHFVRNNGAEIRSGVIVFNNADLLNSVTIERFTVFDFFGNVVHDSGPATGVPHPLNTDFATPVDITVVPPGATFYLSTPQLVTGGVAWDANPMPLLNGNERGNSISVVVQFSKGGESNLFQVHARTRTRQRVVLSSGAAVQGTELSSNLAFCFRVKD